MQEVLFKGRLFNGFPVTDNAQVIPLDVVEDPHQRYASNVYNVRDEDVGRLHHINAWATFQQGASEQRTRGQLLLRVNNTTVRIASYAAKNDPPVSCTLPGFDYIGVAGDTISLHLLPWTPAHDGNVIGDTEMPYTGMEIVAV